MKTEHELKRCSRCNQEKQLNDFGTDNRKGIPKAICRVCDSEIHRLRYHKIGLTPEQKERASILAQQKRETLKEQGICPICGKPAYDQIYCLEHRQARAARARDSRRSQPRLCPGCKQSTLSFHHRLCAACSDTRGERWRKYQRQWRDSQKLDVFLRYGGARCACCGETEINFLTIDHINNDGAAHRKAMFSSGSKGRGRIYPWLKKNGYPPGFRVLCFNCNCGRQLNGGICPHEQKREHPIDAMLSRLPNEGVVN